VKIRIGALTALITGMAVLVVATAAVGAVTLRDAPAVSSRPSPRLAETRAVPRMLPVDRGPAPIVGIASNYPGTAGWMGQATVALPGDLGGRYTGTVNGFVTVCADRCARLPVVDWCQCFWGTDEQRIVDLSHAAWALVSDAPLAEGLIEVRVQPGG
jgi:hypothetical protein